MQLKYLPEHNDPGNVTLFWPPKKKLFDVTLSEDHYARVGGQKKKVPKSSRKLFFRGKLGKKVSFLKQARKVTSI